MCKKGFWVKPAFLLPVLLAVALLAGCANPAGGGGESEPQPPVAPVIATIATGNQTITVTWGAVSGATSYEVYYSESGTAPTSSTSASIGVDIEGTTATISSLTNGTSYYVWIRAKNSAGTSDYIAVGSSALTPSATPQAPAAPEISGVIAGNTTMTVTWGAVANAATYAVYYGTTDVSGSATPGDATITDTSVTITGLDNGTQYYVWVTATNTTGTSGYSNSAFGTPADPSQPPAKPVISGVTGGNGTLTVTWGAVTNATSYEVYHSANSTPPASPTETVNEVATATITGLTNGAVYNVWIKAKSDAGTSDYSVVQTGIPYNPAPLTALTGAWLTAYGDGHTITGTTVAYDDGGSYGGSYTGTVKYVTTFATGEGETSGLIIVQYDSPPTATTPNFEAGYYAIYYKGDPATEPLKFANAYKVSSYTDPIDTETLAEAFTAFTGTGYYNAFIGGWFGENAYNPKYDSAYVTPNLSTALSALTGTWDSYADWYVITGSTSTIKYDDGYPAFSADFAGNIKYVDEYKTGEGIIIIEYTEKPESPYTSGPDTNYLGIYYEASSANFRFANAKDDTGTATDSLAAAIVKYTEANKTTFVTTTGLYRAQPDTVFDMGPLLGNWEGDDDISGAMYTTGPIPTVMKISDHRLTVFMSGAVGPTNRWYSGAIVDRTDPTEDSGYIWIQCTQSSDVGLLGSVLDAELNDCYAIYWYKENEKVHFSIYNDNEDVLSNDLATLKTHTDLDPYFLEYTEINYVGENDGMACAQGGNEGVFVGFTK
jgi:hypothetical protein